MIRKKRRPVIWWKAIKESFNSKANSKTLDNINTNPDVVNADILFFRITLPFVNDLVSCQCCAIWISINRSHTEAPIQWMELQVFPVPPRPAIPKNNKTSTTNLDCFDKKSFFIFHLAWELILQRKDGLAVNEMDNTGLRLDYLRFIFLNWLGVRLVDFVNKRVK